jgi:hypothetical protein
MGWAETQEAMRAAIALALLLPDELGGDGATYNHTVEWSNRYRAARWTPGPWADLRLGAVVARGHDEARTVAEDADGRQVKSYGGYRLVTVSVSVGSFSQEGGSESVGAIASRLRTRLRRPEVRAILAAEGIALVRLFDTVEADFEADNRAVSYAVTDIRFAITELDTDEPDAGSEDIITRVVAEGEPDLDGVDLDVDAS